MFGRTESQTLLTFQVGWGVVYIPQKVPTLNTCRHQVFNVPVSMCIHCVSLVKLTSFLCAVFLRKWSLGCWRWSLLHSTTTPTSTTFKKPLETPWTESSTVTLSLATIVVLGNIAVGVAVGVTTFQESFWFVEGTFKFNLIFFLLQ